MKPSWPTILRRTLAAALVTAFIPVVDASRAMGAAPTPSPAGDPMQAEGKAQYESLAGDLRAGQRYADEAYRAEATLLKTDRDPLDVVLRRTAALLAHLQTMPGAPELAGPAGKLQQLRDAADKADPQDLNARGRLFDQACQVRRQIALSNPLLNFRELLILTRKGIGAGHMCDQYYGQTQQPGGGIMVLSDAFGDAPKLRDVLKDSTVSNGRLKGQKLTSAGSFLSPALSYDARRIAFAYVECTGPKGHEQHTDPSRGHWPVGWSYHIFAANIDGSDLRMLTDGNWNEFSPCFMPSGRIAFITERRGGYLRCGRTCPTYTLYDMAADGSDIRCLSYHETNEWAPSVTHSGMIAWTRWDYVDRHGCVTHMPWLTTPDGRDPRPVHGNYAPRSKRPDMETDVRAIPGSRRFVATAAPHHGQSFGSLIVIDPEVKDDDGMAPVRRLTPEVGFPESQGRIGRGGGSYGQAWPLSEEYFLCAYRASGSETYGIYLIDAFGNRELIHRDPAINSLSPIPIRSQRVPPVIPDLSARVPEGQPAEAVVNVVDVYDSVSSWPAKTRIKALRVYQIYPLSLPCDTVFGRHETGPRIPQGSDSINLARGVLGTVPVESDGSAHFIAPARKELYFQALDERGLAVTSMRSGTHFMANERATCQGCHEPKHRAPVLPVTSTTLALRRAPSRIAPDVDGSNPISYPRLVQPVLDKHCVACHAKNADKAPPLDRRIPVVAGRKTTAYFNSYHSLIKKHAFYSYPDYHRTTPGRFGAQASGLYQMLAKGHNDVKLSSEEMGRITLWLDSVSLFYGVYEPEGQQTQLRGEVARPTLE